LALAAALLVAGCGHLFLLPDDDLVLTPATLGLGYETVRIDDGRGPVLHGWYLPAEAGRVAGTVVFLHGNAENISNHLPSVAWMPERGFNVLLVDYRGYGASEGVATLAGAAADARRMLVHAAAREGVGVPLAVLGQSLGGGLAPYTVAGSQVRGRVAAVVLDSAFAGFRRIARDKLGAFWLTWPLQVPLSLTVPDRFSAERHIADLAPIPVLIIQGGADTIVPPANARALHKRARPPRELWRIPDTGHIRALRRQPVRDRLANYLWRWMDGPGQVPPAPERGSGFRLDTR
jgi:hypothetical protein